jgi:FkbM family methyltransferase
MNYIFFDIGANWGTDSLDKTKNDQNVITWAFEPTPELITHLTEKSKDYANRYHIIPLALSNVNGTAQFNIADSPGCDWGCSSLNTFSDNLDQTWPGRTDFKVTRTIEVQVSRFDTWYQTNGINLDKIDFFHCDTQGSDLKVLQGMGNLVSLIQEGVVECARDERAKLYAENHTLEEMKDFLNENGFEITRQISNDPWSNEINLYFINKNSRYKSLIHI